MQNRRITIELAIDTDSESDANHLQELLAHDVRDAMRRSTHSASRTSCVEYDVEPVPAELTSNAEEEASPDARHPIGVTPRWLLDERRAQALAAAIKRYLKKAELIAECAEELREIVERHASAEDGQQ